MTALVLAQQAPCIFLHPPGARCVSAPTDMNRFVAKVEGARYLSLERVELLW